MRVVLDTSTAVSGLLWVGPPRHIIQLAEQEQVSLWSSLALLRELEEVLAREKFKQRIEAMETSSEALLNHYVSLVEVVAVEQPVHIVNADPDDDIAVSCALAAKADYLVASDGHLLALGLHSGIPIVSPQQFLTEMGTSPPFTNC